MRHSRTGTAVRPVRQNRVEDEAVPGSNRGGAALMVAVVDERGRAAEPRLARWLAAVAPPRARGAVTVALVSDSRVRALNRRYRGKDYATDVLSFRQALHHGGRGGHRGSILILEKTGPRCPLCPQWWRAS
ncbi:MAG: rRNA maturation RNAse YbeY [Acidobacteria bacterium]|nr:rRNA maturation RNAse YbeY [Acidobacteriota bacterium]